jgi:DNA-binding winged helix-turn-helix (wHTH) protein/Tol biopolymer transport system component
LEINGIVGYEFGPFYLDLDGRVLLREGEMVALPPKALETLVLLVENHGSIVSRERILQRVWPDTFVEEGNVSWHVWALRAGLERSGQPDFIKTVPRRGYIFSAEVRPRFREVSPAGAAVQGPSAEAPSRTGEVPAPGPPVIADSPAASVPQIASIQLPPHLSARRRFSLSWISTIVLAVALVAALVARRSSEPAVPGTGFAVTEFVPGEFIKDATISRDGKMLAWAADLGHTGATSVFLRLASGGATVRVGSGRSNDSAPDLSPDGRDVVFRSEAGAGGVYIAPASGISERLIGPLGLDPRFSPDGNRILYWIRSKDTGWGSIFVVALYGADQTPQQVAPEFVDAHHPIWAPDGQHILFCGSRKIRENNERDWHDWWVNPIAGGEAVRTEMFARLKKFVPNPDLNLPGDWRGDRILFTLNEHDTPVLKQIGVDASGRPTGDPAPIAPNTNGASNPRYANEGRIVFTGLQDTVAVWGLSLDRTTGQGAQSPFRLTPEDTWWRSYSTLSRDGSVMSFLSADRVTIHNFSSGNDLPLTSGPGRDFQPVLSPDGSQVAFRYRDQPGQPVHLWTIPVKGGGRQLLCDACDQPTDWSTDMAWMLVQTTRPRRIELLDVKTRRLTELIGRKPFQPQDGRFSPDGRWIAFQSPDAENNNRLFVVAFDPARGKAADTWVPVAAGGADSAQFTNPAWGADGRKLYYVASRNGVGSIEAVPFNGDARPAFGSPETIHAFLDVGQVLNEEPLSVARDKLVYTSDHVISKAWMLTPTPPAPGRN